MVEATAGSGKTTVLVEIARRIPTDTSVCFLAFNQHAAQQLKHRLPEGRKAKTIHSASLGALLWHFRRAGVENACLDNSKYRDLARAVLAQHEPKEPLSKREQQIELEYFKRLLDYTRYELAEEHAFY